MVKWEENWKSNLDKSYLNRVCIVLQVDYSIDVTVKSHVIPCACSKLESLNLNTVSAFEVSVKLMNMKVGPLFVCHLWVVKWK